jgi:hypothetical protein
MNDAGLATGGGCIIEQVSLNILKKSNASRTEACLSPDIVEKN